MTPTVSARSGKAVIHAQPSDPALPASLPLHFSEPSVVSKNEFHPGDHGGGVTPVPIPNTAVKPSSADGTARVAWWESRTSPGFFLLLRREAAAPDAVTDKGPGPQDQGLFLFPRPTSHRAGGAAAGGRRPGLPCYDHAPPESRRSHVRTFQVAHDQAQEGRA